MNPSTANQGVRHSGDEIKRTGIVPADWESLKADATSPIEIEKTKFNLSDLSKNRVMLLDGLMVPGAPAIFRPVDEWMTSHPGAVTRLPVGRLPVSGLTADLRERPASVLLCEREHWGDLYKFLNQARVVDTVNRRVISCFLHAVVLSDPTLPEETKSWRDSWVRAVKVASAVATSYDWVCDVVADFPSATVAFALGGEDADSTWYFDSQCSPPRLVRGPGSSEMANMTAILFPKSGQI